MIVWLLIFLFIVAFLLTGLIRRLALKTQMIDVPNYRSSHTQPTPRGGGLALVFTFLLGSLLLYAAGAVDGYALVAVCLPCFLVAAVGCIDDVKPLGAPIRLCVHFVAVAVALYLLNRFSLFCLTESHWSWIHYFVAAFALVWFLNLYNFMDGIDGLAGVETLCIACGAVIIISIHQQSPGYTLWLLALCVTTLGFLVWNWPPASIFMGDSGSGALGLTLGLFALVVSSETDMNIWSFLILGAVFVSDTSVTLFIRFVRGEQFYKAHRSHAYQILSRRWGSHLKVVLCILAVNVFWLFPLAYCATILSEYAVYCTLIALLPLVVSVIYLGAGKSAS